MALARSWPLSPQQYIGGCVCCTFQQPQDYRAPESLDVLLASREAAGYPFSGLYAKQIACGNMFLQQAIVNQYVVNQSVCSFNHRLLSISMLSINQYVPSTIGFCQSVCCQSISMFLQP